MRKEEYLRMGMKQNGKDKKLTRKEVQKIEKRLDDHTRMLSKIMNIGESHDHLSRMLASKISTSILLQNTTYTKILEASSVGLLIEHLRIEQPS